MSAILFPTKSDLETTMIEQKCKFLELDKKILEVRTIIKTKLKCGNKSAANIMSIRLSGYLDLQKNLFDKFTKNQTLIDEQQHQQQQRQIKTIISTTEKHNNPLNFFLDNDCNSDDDDNDDNNLLDHTQHMLGFNLKEFYNDPFRILDNLFNPKTTDIKNNKSENKDDDVNDTETAFLCMTPLMFTTSSTIITTHIKI